MTYRRDRGTKTLIITVYRDELRREAAKAAEHRGVASPCGGRGGASRIMSRAAPDQLSYHYVMLTSFTPV
jgi:hypothetical protein